MGDPFDIIKTPITSSKKETVGDEISKLIRNGTSIEDIATDEDYGGYTLLHLQAMQRYSDLVRPAPEPVATKLEFSPILGGHPGTMPVCAWLNSNIRADTRPIKTPQLWLYGPPNVGKSSFVLLLEKHLSVYVHAYESWYDDLTNLFDIMILDDYGGELKPALLNRLVDGSTVMLPRRGRRPFRKHRNIPVIVLSNRSIQDTYPNADQVGVVALQTRFLELPVETGEKGQYISQIKINEK